MNAVAYVRYSSDNQREESIEAQLRAIREYAGMEDITVVKVYADEARSATTDNRPEFQHMMADAAAGIFQAVIVHKLDRFSRDRYDSAYYKRLLKKAGVCLISVLERLDDSPESIIMESVLEGMAEYYSRNLAREVMKGMKETAYECKHTGGQPPLGYDVTPDKTYTVNLVEAEAVKMIFAMYADGIGCGKIIDALSGRGFRTKTGRPFGKNSLHEILKNEKYHGVFVFNKIARKAAGSRNGHKQKDNAVIIRITGGIPAIVPESTWLTVQNRMAHHLKEKNGAMRAKAVYLLSGRVACGTCKGAMVGNQLHAGRNKALYAYYECSTRKRTKNCDMKPINKDIIESMVIDCLYDNLFSPKVIDEVASSFHELIAEKLKEVPGFIKTTKKQLTDIERQISNIVDAVAKGLYSEELKDKMKTLQAQKSILKVRMDEAIHEQKNYFFIEKQIKNYLSGFSRIKDMTQMEKKRAVEIFVDQVIVYHDSIDVQLPFCPNNKAYKNNRGTTAKQDGFPVCGPSANFGYDGGGEPYPTVSKNIPVWLFVEQKISKTYHIELCNYRHK